MANTPGNVDPLQNTVGPSLKNGTCPERLAVAASSEVLDSVTEKTKRTLQYIVQLRISLEQVSTIHTHPFRPQRN